MNKSLSNPIRVLVAKVGLDGHDRGAKVIATSLRDAGMEVIYTGLRQTPEMVVNAALQEDVDAIGISILSGAHMTVFPKIISLMREKNLTDVLLTGGGIIPEEDCIRLQEMGVGKLFTPGAATSDIATYIRDWVKKTEDKNCKPMYETLSTDLTDNIYIITINRPEKLNALNKTVIREIGEAVDEIYSNPLIRAAIITGSGNRAFAAGADIRGFEGLTKEEGMALAKQGLDVFLKIENSPKPIVAAVNGFALGGGCELAMSCHFRLCSETAQFGQPEISLGLIPGYGGTQRLTRYIGKGPATEAMLTGNLINATVALQYGLVNHITSPEELINKTKSILIQIISKAPLAISKCITAINAAFDAGAGDGYTLETNLFGECFATDDMKEGTAAFLEKRKPVFRGR